MENRLEGHSSGVPSACCNPNPCREDLLCDADRLLTLIHQTAMMAVVLGTVAPEMSESLVDMDQVLVLDFERVRLLVHPANLDFHPHSITRAEIGRIRARTLNTFDTVFVLLNGRLSGRVAQA